MTDEVKIKHSLLQKITELRNTHVSRLAPLLDIGINICFSYCEEICFDGYIDFSDASSKDGKDAIVSINGKGEMFFQNGGYQRESDDLEKADRRKNKIRKLQKASFYIVIFTSITTLLLSALVYLKNDKIKELEGQLYTHKNMILTPTQRNSDLVLKAICRGGFSFPDDDSSYYFLVEIKIINNTISSQEFVTYSCSSLINVLVDSKEVKFFYHNCSSNYPYHIKLKPNQEFSLPIMLQTKRKNWSSNNKVKFGYIIMHPRRLKDNESVSQILENMREQQENVIWSEPIELNVTSFKPFKINNLKDSEEETE